MPQNQNATQNPVQVDLVHNSAEPNLEAHVPVGQSGAVNSNPTDNPSNAVPSAVLNSLGKAVRLTVAGVRFSNPS